MAQAHQKEQRVQETDAVLVIRGDRELALEAELADKRDPVNKGKG